MSRRQTLPATSSRNAFQRKLGLIWAVGTLLPMAILAALYVLAPLPMTAATAEVLRTANHFAGTVVLLHWAITLAVWAASKVVKTASPRDPAWQPVELAPRANA